MAVKMIRDKENKWHPLKSLVMDDDTSTICKVREEVNPEIEKCSERNHTFKNVTNHLFLSSKREVQKDSQQKDNNSHQKVFCLCCFIRGDPLALKTNLSAIPHHLYGKHSCCDSKWCRYLQNRESFIPKNLPYGKYLSDVNLYKDIVHIFSLYTEQSETIPPPPPQLVQQPLPSDNNSRVYFDLETNGLGM